MVRLGAVLMLLWPASVVGEVMTSANLRLGDGIDASLYATGEFKGNVKQPFYKTPAGTWKKLTYETNGLDFAIHVKGAASIPGTPIISYDNGIATVVQIAGLVTLTRTYSLAAAIFTMKVKVCADKGSDVENVQIWCGTQDDWIGDTDEVMKTVGKFAGGVFQAAPDGAVVELSSGSEGVFFLTVAPGAKGLFSGVGWSNIEGKTVLSQSEVTTHQGKDTDGSYGIYLPVGDIAQGSCTEAEFLYAAGSADDLANIAQSLPAGPSPPTPSPPTNTTSPPTPTPTSWEQRVATVNPTAPKKKKKGTTSSSDPRRVTHVPLFFVLALVAFH